MLIQRAYKTEIDPTVSQRILCYKSAGVARYAYNWGLARKKQAWEEQQQNLSLYDLKKDWNARKAEEFPWAAEVSTHCMQSAMTDLDRAFANFFRRVKAGQKPGYPRFKSKKRGIGSFRLYGHIHVRENAVQLPTFGLVRLKEKGYLPTGDVKILNATVSEKAGRWYVSLQVEQELPTLAPAEGAVGVDLGVKTLATLSDGTAFENPKALRQAMRKVKRLQRAVSRKQKGSSNRRKACRRLACAHQRVANVRQNAIHQMTNAITKRFGTVVVEDLHVSGMVKNHRLAGAIGDAGFGEIRRQLEYKTKWRGGELVAVDRWFPSSKTCSACGVVRDTLKLSERTFVCPGCGHAQDRDHNAAVNLLRVAGKAPVSKACGDPRSGEQSSVRAVEAGTCLEQEFGNPGALAY